MALFGRKSRWAGVDVLQLVPQRKVQWRQEADRVQLMVPRFREPMIGPWLQRIIPEHKKFIRVPLEHRGSFLWLNMDGRRTVKDLTDILVKSGGDDSDQIYERVSMYVMNLYQNRFIEFLNM